MAKIKKSRREVAAPVTVTANRLPLVSVIIPMYNSAKFIPQTLESLCYQTMTDFEVVVVDDCSTDNSVEVVESFAERLGGGLHVIKLRENTGYPGVVRNVGIQYARGKYVAFLDSDDLFTKTALEELTTLAEKYQADIVHLTDSFRLYPGEDLRPDDPRINNFSELTNPKNFGFTQWRWPIMPRPKPLDAPKLESDTLEERVKNWVSWKYRLGVCANFCRREFLITSQISFPDMVAAEDQVFNFACLCLAKNFLCAPNVVYIVRPRIGSISRDTQNKQTLGEYLNKWMTVLNKGFTEFDQFMTSIPLFKQNNAYRSAVFDFFFMCIVDRHIRGIYLNNQPHAIYPVVKKEFHDNALAAYLFNVSNVYRLQIIKLQKEIAELNKHR